MKVTLNQSSVEPYRQTHKEGNPILYREVCSKTNKAEANHEREREVCGWVAYTGSEMFLINLTITITRGDKVGSKYSGLVRNHGHPFNVDQAQCTITHSLVELCT